MTPLCTGVILAGGENKRFSGENKALVRIGGKRIIDHILDVFADLFEDIILVTNHPLQYVDFNLTIVTDVFPFRSSMTGIHAGLFYTKSPYAFVVACDTPFIKKGLVETVIDAIEPRVDVVVPETSQGLEPLFSVYSKDCLRTLSRHLDEKKLKIDRFFQTVKIKKLPENRLREKDPDLISFFNINTPSDQAKAEAMKVNL